ncbi:hypothetical protein DL764_010636 [Monosporascus ibericus]|uniref:Uncharacterized protein n=1 Tax=Monosporascus ibericus TaxID=155417 RepID=A0A4Q4STX4_9PEZI|nr:hypothetical protein DL764_010636 [Monosporascus ibericus]
MNRFRTKLRGKDGKDEAAARSSQEGESSMHFRPFRKGKKQQETEKVELDLTTALPSDDNFRTSLLMSGLSARFSMLREQDDPNTKVGKASDDSVLFPKRQSKMDVAGLRGLSDIAEVESIKATAPFARVESYYSDDADSTAGGSVMSRGKPTEGNVLFGGRQKIYKIPAGVDSKGGMGGRALYEDDVAMSAFQKWRQSEKERTSSEEGGNEAGVEAAGRLSGDLDTDAPRPESPFLGEWNRKRETSSTTSSAPSITRNSTAATSVASSQPATSVKDSQPNSAACTSTAPAPGPERSVTRTRRLYETGLNNELQEQQSSALSRIDTLTRQRAFGTRTPDLTQNSGSPATAGLREKFSSDRKVLAQASAPNLRSMSPQTTASSVGTPDLGVPAPSRAEGRSGQSGMPPLSPAISESDDYSLFAIRPNDRGKATALGVFQKPTQPYDECKYAQRQIQLQRGRETPTQRRRAESNDSFGESRSRSSSSAPRQPIEPKSSSPSAANPLPLKEDILLGDDSEGSAAVSPKPAVSPRLMVRRPSDRRHPAFRDSAMPTPLSVAPKLGGQPSPASQGPTSLIPSPKDVPPADSPTLGPTSGLSGMVRQHLRADSNASSILGVLPSSADLDSRFPADTSDRNATTDKFNSWGTQPHDWDAGLETSEPIVDDDGQSATVPAETPDRDEFANQLADRARRVREKLTSYVESDSRSTSPHAAGETKNSLDLQPPLRPSGLGIVRPRGSRGSLYDRGREGSQSKAIQMFGVGSRGGSPAPAQRSIEANSATPSMSEEQGIDGTTIPSKNSDAENATDGTTEMHAGIRAFRQARRDLQRLREQETQARRDNQSQGPQGPLPGIPVPRATSTKESNERYGSGSGSRAGSREDTHRGGSGSSNDRHDSPIRYRKFSTSREETQLAPPKAAPRLQLRSPGLPGTDIKNSSILPPHSIRGSPPAKTRTNTPNDSLNVQHSHHYGSGLPSPISRIPSPLAASGRSTPSGVAPSRRPSVSPTPGSDVTGKNNSGLGDGAIRKRSTREISEPILIASSSSAHAAPPVPPINPRRRQENAQARPVTGSRPGLMNGNTLPGQSRGQGNNPGTGIGPPTSRMVSTQGHSNILPGGMI